VIRCPGFADEASGHAGEATDRSRALVVAVTLHSWIDALFEAPALLGVAPGRVYAVFAASLVFWGWMLWRWRGSIEEAKKHSKP